MIEQAAQQTVPAAPVSQRTSSLSRWMRRTYFVQYIILGAGALVMVFPFIWMISTSFKPLAETISFPPRLWPIIPTLENYFAVFERVDMRLLYANTAFLAITKTILNVYTGAALGYVFGKFQFRGRDFFFYLILSTWIIPFEVYMIPLYVMVVKAGLGNTYLALILPEVFSTYAMFLFRQFMFTIPNDLIDAARIDGAGEWFIFHKIVLPLARPVLATLIAFYFMWNWNDFLWPLIVITSSDKYVLPVGLAVFVSEVFSQHGVVMAGATLAILPVLAIFVAMQHYIIEGIALTGLKG